MIMEDDIWQRKHEEQVEEEEVTRVLIARQELEKMLLPLYYGRLSLKQIDR